MWDDRRRRRSGSCLVGTSGRGFGVDRIVGGSLPFEMEMHSIFDSIFKGEYRYSFLFVKVMCSTIPVQEGLQALN